MTTAEQTELLLEPEASITKPKAKLPKGLNQEQVDSWKEHGPIFMGTIGTRRVVVQSYTRGDVKTEKFTTPDEVFAFCTKWVEGGLESFPESSKEGVLSLIEEVSGVPDRKFSLVIMADEFNRQEDPFFKELELRKPDAAKIVLSTLEEYGCCFIHVSVSKRDDLSRIWIIAPVDASEVDGLEEEEIVNFVLASKVRYPGPIPVSETLLAGHYQELVFAVTALLGYRATGGVIEL